ncbi:MAG: hypothetical protein Q9227_002921 [Pyrenula ochraceoflavens]
MLASSPSQRPYPELATIQFQDSVVQDSSSVYASLKDLKRSELSLANRLRSIVEDAEYVCQLQKHLAARLEVFRDRANGAVAGKNSEIGKTCLLDPSRNEDLSSPLKADSSTNLSSTSAIPLVANERNGSWYVSPQLKAASVYFKSTDGHTGQWGFSLRRLNLQLLDILGKNGSAIVVDSTRTGKRFPDALSKTVPIWACVMNRILFAENQHALKTPPDLLPESETAQIEARIPSFVSSFSSLGLDMAALRKRLKRPVKCFWAIHGEPNLTKPPILRRDHKEYNLLILCSASKRRSVPEIGDGAYVQGAADDAEAWSGGLTSDLFWKNRDYLLGDDKSEEKLRELVSELIKNRNLDSSDGKTLVRIKAAPDLYIGTQNSNHPEQSPETSGLIISCNTDPSTDPPSSHPSTPTPSKTLHLSLPAQKLGSRALRQKLASIISFIQSPSHASPPPPCNPSEPTHPPITILSTHSLDLPIGIALAILCLFYDESGQRTLSGEQREGVDKLFIRRRLAWVMESVESAVGAGAGARGGASRATLNGVNEFLMAGRAREMG